MRCWWQHGIDRHGHLKGKLGGIEDGFCAIGALSMAATGAVRGKTASPCISEAWNSLAQFTGGRWQIDFNNDPARTKDEILAWFDKAIAATAPDPLAGLERDIREQEAIETSNEKVVA